MSSPCRDFAFAALACACIAGCAHVSDETRPTDAHASVAAADRARELRVCADGDNLPYSNRQGEGFENRIAEIVAGGLDAHVAYAWAPVSRGWVRKTLGAGV